MFKNAKFIITIARHLGYYATFFYHRLTIGNIYLPVLVFPYRVEERRIYARLLCIMTNGDLARIWPSLYFQLPPDHLGIFLFNLHNGGRLRSIFNILHLTVLSDFSLFILLLTVTRGWMKSSR